MPARARSKSTVPSASLLRRVAEAADGHRTGRKVWFAAKDDNRSDVRGPYTTVAAARAATRGMRRGWQVVGPIQTPADHAPQGLVALRATVRDTRGREHVYDINLATTDMLVARRVRPLSGAALPPRTWHRRRPEDAVRRGDGQTIAALAARRGNAAGLRAVPCRVPGQREEAPAGRHVESGKPGIARSDLNRIDRCAVKSRPRYRAIWPRSTASARSRSPRAVNPAAYQK